MTSKPTPKLFHLVHRLHQSLFRAGDQMLTEKLGISTTQSAVLMYLKGKNGVAMGELADAVGLKITSMSGLVDRMEAKGLLVRRRSDTDRRSFSISLTDAGEQVQKQAEPLVRQSNAALLAAIGDSTDAAAFAEACENIIKAVEEDRENSSSKIQKVS